MKILHKSKRVVPPQSMVQDLITKLLRTPREDLAQFLAKIDHWTCPRSDLHSWIKVLNTFDAIMEEIIKDYDIDKLQLNSFSPDHKKLLSEILRFERMLLENSTNRKLFGSYDRLNSLLFTSDLDVLTLALNLLLRPSQQYSAQPSVSHALNISTPRLQSLAKRWPQLREYGISLVDLAGSKSSTALEALPAEAHEVSFTFYRTDNVATTGEDKNLDVSDASQTSPRKVQPPSGAVNVHLSGPTVLSKPAINVFADAIDAYDLPDEEKYELLCRIRAAQVLSRGHETDREKLVAVRLLAIAIYGHTHSESQATSSLFLYEPDLIAHIAELLQVDQGIPIYIQTTAISALDALARYRNRIQEVLTAVNAGVNHGILMALFRKTVVEVLDPESTIPNSFVEALLSFVTFIASHASGGNMVVGAGLIPLLIQLIDNKSTMRLPVVSKTMQLVDNVLYSFTNAFNLFCTARGVEVLVERIQFEVDLDIKEYGSRSRDVVGQSEVPVARVALLKHVLRSIHRMMQSSGTAEGLRGLIDMSLLKSIKKVIEYRGLFGLSILPIAINIMATFVHNEPTSLAIIQEAGLPDTFFRAIEAGIEPSIEVIQAMPNALGALCLNEGGQAQLAKRPSIIPAIFSIFTSHRHVKVLIEKENAVLIGTAIDELIRHHPSLKAAVFESLKSTLGAIEDLGMAYNVPNDIKQWYQLLPIPSATTADTDIAMDLDVRQSPAGITTFQERWETQADGDAADDETTNKSHDNVIVSYIDVFNRFLEGLFQHTPHCKDFIAATDGLARLGRLTGLPCLPYDFANSVASDSMVQVMRTMIEVSASETLLHLARLVKESLEDTRSFWESMSEFSKLLPFIDISEPDELESSNLHFRNLVTLHIRVTLLSDVFATAGYAHGRAAIGLLQTLMANISSQVVTDLGALHRASIWENVVLSAGLVLKGLDVQTTPSSSPLEISPNRSAVNLPDTEAVGTSSVPNNVANGVVQSNTDRSNVGVGKIAKADGPRYHNAAALKQVTHGLPVALAPFFQAMVKMFYARRNPDPAQKKQISDSSAVLAEIMLKHLTLRSSYDTPSLYTYYSVIFGLLTVLLIEERTSTSTLHTVQLSAFFRSGGLNAIFDVCHMFMTTIESIVKIKEDRSEMQNKELSHAYGGIKVALHLLHPIISSKPLFESGQTLLLMTRERKDTDPEYFEPHNFLVKLRLAALPLVRNLWESSWLTHAPLGVSRSVVRTVLEITNGEDEEPKGDMNLESGLISNAPPRPAGPDENRIQMLVDMGFPRSAAVRALIRSHNNVTAATNYLLEQPFPPPPDPEAEQVPEPSETAEPSAQENASPPNPTTEDMPEQSQTEIGKSSEEWRRLLEDAREPLRASIGRQSLLLVDEHISLLFDLHVSFTKLGEQHQKQAVRNLVEDVRSFIPTAYRGHEQPLANRCRLIALVLCEKPSSLDVDLRSTLMDDLLVLLSSIDINHLPRWLASHLLVTEALFTLGDEPRTITLPKEEEPILPERISNPPHRTDARGLVFDFCLRLLTANSLPGDEFLSVLRLLVLFTRDREVVSQFVLRDGLSSLFKRIRLSAVAGSSSYIAIILRHVVEDVNILKHIMHLAVQRYFAQPRSRVVDVNTFVRNCSAMALRDPHVFISTTEQLCTLGQPYSSSPHISLKTETVKPESQPPFSDSEGLNNMQVDQSSSVRTIESIIHLLVGELMFTTKSIHESISQTDNPIDQKIADIVPGAPENPQEGTEPTPQEATDADQPKAHDKYQYSCFLMQCLTELLFSYDACKIAFLSYSPKKRLVTPSKEPLNRFRMATLQFLLSDLVTFGTINPQPNAQSRSRITLCNWAMSVIVALCVDSSHEAKEVSPDLVAIRKFVLETISRAIKDLPASEPTEARYGRLLALADLCHRLLTVRFNNTLRKQQDEVPTHIAKVMLEKSFVATLTAALSEVDLNYPNVRSLVASVLRPLEYLSKIAIKMSRSSGKGKDADATAKTESEASLDSDEDEEDTRDTGREETPDLYRNSSLGMYGGEMDDGNFDDEEDMEEDDRDEDEDVEMDFGDDTGSEDTTNTDDDGEDDIDHATHDSEEAWGDGGEVWGHVDDEEEGLVENDEGEEEDAEDEHGDGDDGDEDEEEEEEDMAWEEDNQSEHDEFGPVDEGDEDGEREVPIQILHEDDADADAASDDEDFAMENGTFTTGNLFYFGNLNDGSSRDTGGLFVPRRHRTGGDESIQVFGRARNAPAPAPEATTHPLLLDVTSASNRPHNIQNRPSRQPQRFVTSGTNDLFQTIDELMGGGSIQFFQHILARGRGGAGPETFRLDVPTGTLVNLDRHYLQHRRGAPGMYSTAIRVERARPQNQRQGHEFDPLLTLQRWAEEVKIIQGDFVAERAGNLANHVCMSLLPAAAEAAKQAKIQEEIRMRETAEAAIQIATEIEKTTEGDVDNDIGATTSRDTDVPTDVPQTDTTPWVDLSAGDQVMHDARLAPDEDAEMVDAVADVPPVVADVETTDSSNAPAIGGPAETPSTPSRVTVMIHGSAVDITETGIDPTFLEALPDDLREEVLNQHVRDQRAARVERPADSQISTEFLDALPPEIRAEIIQQETIERARLRDEDTSAPPRGASTGRPPADIDPASLIASLDPTLRQAILMEQDDLFIQSLPSHMIAEAGTYRGNMGGLPPRGRLTSNALPNPNSHIRKIANQHDAIQLLDKPGIAILVRLLFFPQVLKKTLLFKVLVNLCENSKTRTDLFNLLLNILQDGTGDLAAVDKSFSQMSVKNTKPQTSKAVGKQKASIDYLAALTLPTTQVEMVPDLIVQRCLEGLTYIVTSNELSSLFFLTEHELPAGLRKTVVRKGKGKEKQVSQTHYPIVLLLSLLDRQSLLRTPAIMESVVGLLATVTRPLASLKDNKKQVESVASTSAKDSIQEHNVTPTIESNAAVPQQATGQQSSPDQQPPSEHARQELTGDQPVEPTSEEAMAPSASRKEHKPSVETVEEKMLLANPPQIPHSVLRLIVNILTVGECSGRTFQQSLALIQHLSYIPDARDVIAHELKSRAQEFGHSLHVDLDELAVALQGSQSDSFVNAVATKFSPASSIQAKLLRVLKTIDYMYTPKAPANSQTTEGDDIEKVQAIYESFRFTPLWQRLGDCLAVIEEKPDMEHIANVLLPLIEALMVVCKYVGTKAQAQPLSRILRASASPRSPTTARESMEDLFISFTDAHRKILNLMVRNNPSLMSGSFSLLVNNPRVLDFDNKRNYFNQQLHRRPHMREHHGTIQLNVRRPRVFEDSFQQFLRRTGEQIKYGKLSVRFYDEEGVDAGGVTREWFQILARQMFDPNNALFQPCAADRLTYQPNKNSWVNPEHLSFFKFVGRVIGKAIYDGRLLDAYFARSLYRQLLGKPVDYKDVEWVDPEYYNSLCWILENDPTPLDLNFSVEADEFGVNRIIALKEGGESLPVTQENKRDFVQLSAQYRLYSSIKDQIENLSSGFYEIIPKDLITIFNEKELELLISGTPDIDVDEWRAATEYNGYNSSDPNIVWWWRALKSFNRDERAKVLSFATGTSRVPLGGFSDLQGVQGVQRFSIHRAYGEPDRLPQAHTCFNQIDLPQYTSYELLRRQLLMAINEGGEGFAFS